MKLAFFGSPEDSIAPLQHLLDQGADVALVVSQPAKPAGRGRHLIDPPVATFAKEKGLPLLQPTKASDPDFLEQLQSFAIDVVITCAYGQILTQSFLDIPRRATINIHPSLLPKFRGATPVNSSILAGDSQTGVTVLFTVRKLDAGHIIIQEETAIG